MTSRCDRKLLVVNADDLGICGAVNRGIARCFEAGVVTQASLMMPCPAAAEGVRLAKERALPVAVHLTLASEWDRVRWGPLSGGESLVGADGAFPPDVPALKAVARPEEVLAELEAQVDAVLATGLEPVSLDSHMQLYDEDAMALLVRRYGIRSRDPLPRHPDCAIPYASAFRMSPLHPDLKLQALCNHVRTRGPGIHLVVCHPAEDDPELLEMVSPAATRWHRAWVHGVRVSDLETLLDPAFAEACAEAGVELVPVSAAGAAVQRPSRRALRNPADSGPVVLGATGGSGTRAVAGILRRAGVFLGARVNESEDAYDFAGFADRWLNAFLTYAEALPPALEGVMVDDLTMLLERHCRELEAPGPWGWKEPRSMFLLPFLDRHLPTLRFVHVVRDGRDIAFSENQNQLFKHGEVLGVRRPGVALPVQSIALWSTANLAAARYGEERLGDRYLRIRLEDLCADPAAGAERLFAFLGLDVDPHVAAAEVTPPPSLGRWRSADERIVARLTAAAADALAAFGYEPGAG